MNVRAGEQVGRVAEAPRRRRLFRPQDEVGGRRLEQEKLERRAAGHGWRGEPEVRERGERKEEAGAGAWRR